MLLLMTKNCILHFKTWLSYFKIDQILFKKKIFKNNSYAKLQEALYLLLPSVFPNFPSICGSAEEAEIISANGYRL